MNNNTEINNKFGGKWTYIKLDVFKGYLEAYLTALKNKKFKCIYIDAFAGTGECLTREGAIDGSAKIALDVGNFYKHIFIENNPEFCSKLNKLRESYKHRSIDIINGDANIALPKILNKYSKGMYRVLLFLDPYNLNLHFKTLKQISQIKNIDIWYLFNFSVILRFLNKNNLPNKTFIPKIENVFGIKNWDKLLYKDSGQISIFDEPDIKRVDTKDICCFYKNVLKETFPYVSCPIKLVNSKKAPLFLLFFLMTNPSPKAIVIGKKISNHLIKKQNSFECLFPKL